MTNENMKATKAVHDYLMRLETLSSNCMCKLSGNVSWLLEL